MREESQFRLRLKKTHAFVADAGVTTEKDWVIEQLQYNDTNVDTYMEGAQYEIQGASLNDVLKFQVVHPDPNIGILDEFADIAAINGSHLLEAYLAKLYPGLLLRLCYVSTGITNVEVKCNIIRHLTTP